MLELTSVVKKYKTKAGDTAALNDVTVRFDDTGLVFITGKSGSGKTTLLNVIGGLDGIDSGEISINGKDFSKFTPSEFDSYRNTFIGFIFQEYNLLSEYSVGKNVEIANELQGKKTNEEDVEALFEKVDIAGMQNRKTSQLSGGQKQRVAIARALIKNPKIIMADEPTGALDSATGKQIIASLKELSKEKLVIVVSHDLELAEKYADRIIRLVDGRIVEDVTLSDVQTKSNLYETEEELTVRTGFDLTKEETSKLVGAIKESKKITFTNKISVRERKKTRQPKRREISEEEKNTQLINSKMKFKSALHLGLKAVAIKPVRLVFTILLSVIAFAVFGVFDSIASYDNAVAISRIIKEGTFPTFSTYATYTDESYQGLEIKLTDEQIDEINNNTGYKFRGVYELDDEETIVDTSYANRRRQLNGRHLIDNMPTGAGYNESNFNYYSREVGGLLPFDLDEVETVRDEETGKIISQVVDKNGFNLKMVAGEFPTDSSATGAAHVAISKHLAESTVYWANRFNKHIIGDKTVNNIEDVVGVTFTIRGVGEYYVTGIFDCGAIPSKYSNLKEAESGASSQEKEDYNTYLRTGTQLLFFTTNDYITNLRAQKGRAVNYVIDSLTTKYSAYFNESKNHSLYYYSTSDVPQEKLGVFSQMLNNSSFEDLKEDEMLIHEDHFTTIYHEEIVRARANEEFGAEFKAQLEKFTDSFDYNDRKDALQYMIEKIMLEYESTNSDEVFGKNIYIQGKNRNSAENSLPTYTKNMKVVGVYFAVDIDEGLVNGKFSPFMVSDEGLDYLGVYSEQGIYSRMITPINSNNKSAKAIGKLMDTQEGVKLVWHANTVLEIIEENKELLSGFINLFLIIALVLLAFSIFMLYNYISTSIMSKKQSVGVLRALGANSKNIFYMFLTESLVIALVSGILACLVAFLACIFVNSYVVNVLELTLNIAQYGVRQIVIIGLGSIFAGILSSIIPIIKVVKKKPVELIRKV